VSVPSKQKTFKRPFKIIQDKPVDCQIFRKTVPRRRSGAGECHECVLPTAIQANRHWYAGSIYLHFHC